MKRVRHLTLRTESQVIKVTLEVNSKDAGGWDRPGFIHSTNRLAGKVAEAIAHDAFEPVFNVRVK